MNIPAPKKSPPRAAIIILLLAATAAAAGDWVIFKGQVNGPVKAPGGVNPAAFTLKRYPQTFSTETYYHHLNSPDGSAVMVSIRLDRSEVSVAFTYCKPGATPYKDFVILKLDDLKLDARGFGFAVGGALGRAGGRNQIRSRT